MNLSCRAVLRGLAAIAVLAAAAGLTACHAPLRSSPSQPTAVGESSDALSAAPVAPALAPASVQQLAAAIAADARRADHEKDSTIRGQLAAAAARDAAACLGQAPQAAACVYSHALALGLDARAHPLRAGESLKAMLAALEQAEAMDSGYDEAGPARVAALVRVRAPGWPLGPGDPDAGLAAAQRAAALRPQYPPNELALAEALAKTGDGRGAQAAFARARDLSQALPPGVERDEWLHDAVTGLGDLH